MTKRRLRMVWMAFSVMAIAVVANGFEKMATDNLKDGLVLYLSFDKVADGKVIDQSGKGNHGELLGGEIVDGKIGKALKLDADSKSDGVLVKDDDSLDLDSVTIAAWIKTDHKDDQWNRILDKGWNTAYNFCIGGEYQGKRWQEKLYFECAERATCSWKPVVDGEWHFVAATYEDQLVRIFIDGEPDMKRKLKKERSLEHNDVDIRIGQLAVPEPAPYDAPFFDGLIDEVRLYNRALSEEEIKSLYNFKQKKEKEKKFKEKKENKDKKK